jgi:hypothetical protein
LQKGNSQRRDLLAPFLRAILIGYVVPGPVLILPRSTAFRVLARRVNVSFTWIVNSMPAFQTLLGVLDGPAALVT